MTIIVLPADLEQADSVTVSVTLDIIGGGNNSQITSTKADVQLSPDVLISYLNRLLEMVQEMESADHYQGRVRQSRRTDNGAYVLTIILTPKPKSPPALPAGAHTFQEFSKLTQEDCP